MKLRNRDELVSEINRVLVAITKTDSPKLKRDYGKHLKRMYRDLRYYDKSFENGKISDY